MALIICPECGKQVSDRANSCPNCGFPIAQHIAEENKRLEEKKLEDIKRNRIEELAINKDYHLFGKTISFNEEQRICIIVSNMATYSRITAHEKIYEEFISDYDYFEEDGIGAVHDNSLQLLNLIGKPMIDAALDAIRFAASIEDGHNVEIEEATDRLYGAATDVLDQFEDIYCDLYNEVLRERSIIDSNAYSARVDAATRVNSIRVDRIYSNSLRGLFSADIKASFINHLSNEISGKLSKKNLQEKLDQYERERIELNRSAIVRLLYELDQLVTPLSAALIEETLLILADNLLIVNPMKFYGSDKNSKLAAMIAESDSKPSTNIIDALIRAIQEDPAVPELYYSMVSYLDLTQKDSQTIKDLITDFNCEKHFLKYIRIPEFLDGKEALDLTTSDEDFEKYSTLFDIFEKNILQMDYHTSKKFNKAKDTFLKEYETNRCIGDKKFSSIHEKNEYELETKRKKDQTNELINIINEIHSVNPWIEGDRYNSLILKLEQLPESGHEKNYDSVKIYETEKAKQMLEVPLEIDFEYILDISKSLNIHNKYGDTSFFSRCEQRDLPMNNKEVTVFLLDYSHGREEFIYGTTKGLFANIKNEKINIPIKEIWDISTSERSDKLFATPDSIYLDHFSIRLRNGKYITLSKAFLTPGCAKEANILNMTFGIFFTKNPLRCRTAM